MPPAVVDVGSRGVLVASMFFSRAENRSFDWDTALRILLATTFRFVDAAAAVVVAAVGVVVVVDVVVVVVFVVVVGTFVAEDEPLLLA